MKIKVDRACRLCKQVPEDGYFKSRIVRNDFVCPACLNKMQKERRKKLSEQLSKGEKK